VESIPDEAIVVRGGRNRPEDIQRGTGISVECGVGLPVEELAATIPHGQVGITTVDEIRQVGGDVIRTSGRSPNHATLTGLTPEQISKLLTPAISNPSRQEP
jgi:hypothetical protein